MTMEGAVDHHQTLDQLKRISRKSFRTLVFSKTFLIIVLLSLLTFPLLTEARGKKKKSGGAAGGAPICPSLGLDCSQTCCLYNYCAESKLDCVTYFERPFNELYKGFATIFLIIVGISILIAIINFCMIYKFCQVYDEDVEAMVGGHSICDAISCFVTCGLVLKKNHAEGGVSAEDLDFRSRFRKSMDK